MINPDNITALDGPNVTEDDGTLQADNVLPIQDSEIPIEEYIYFAKLSRARESQNPRQPGDITASTDVTSSVGDGVNQTSQTAKESGGPLSCGEVEHLSRVQSKKHAPEAFPPLDISEGEWTQAARAARTATW